MVSQWIPLLLIVLAAVEAFSPEWLPHRTTRRHRGAPTLQMRTLAYANITDVSPKTLTVCRRPRSTMTSSKQSAATKKWNQRFEQLSAFYKTHSHLEPHEPKALVTWIRNQRSQYRYMHQEDKQHLCFLTAERIQKLDSLGFCWNPQEAKWNRMFAQLVEYKERFGHCNVPSKWKENIKLSQWVSQQRFKYKARQQGRKKIGDTIKTEQIERLNSIGFCWHPKRDVWWNMYRFLQEYKEKHGNCAVPQAYAPNPELGVWVRHQRRACRELVLSLAIEKKTEGVYVSGIDKERLEALREISFCWLPDPKEPWRAAPKDIFDYNRD